MRKRVVWITVGIIALVLLYPFQTTVVPEWTLRVVDEKGAPVSSKLVRESWAHYSLELDPTVNSEDRWTDEAGYVTFPRATVRASLLRRAVFPIVTAAYTFAHGSTGVHAYVIVWHGADAMPLSLNYEPNKPLPGQIVLPNS